MIRRIRGMVAVTAALGLAVAACAEDPLSDLDGNPAAIATSATQIVVTVGDTAALTASVIDGRTTPLTQPVTFAACAGTIAVANDASYDPVPATSFRALVIGVSADSTCVNLSGGGLQSQVTVIVP